MVSRWERLGGFLISDTGRPSGVGVGQALVVLDTLTRARTVVDVRLPGPSTTEIFAVSPDNRTTYYGAARAEADIWIVERK